MNKQDNLLIPLFIVAAPMLSNDDQLYVYEAAATLIISGATDISQKETLMRGFLSPVLIKVETLAQRLSAEQHPAKQVYFLRHS